MSRCYVVLDYDFVVYAGDSLEQAQAADEDLDAVVQVWENGGQVGYWQRTKGWWRYYQH